MHQEVIDYLVEWTGPTEKFVFAHCTWLGSQRSHFANAPCIYSVCVCVQCACECAHERVRTYVRNCVRAHVCMQHSITTKWKKNHCIKIHTMSSSSLNHISGTRTATNKVRTILERGKTNEINCIVGIISYEFAKYDFLGPKNWRFSSFAVSQKRCVLRSKVTSMTPLKSKIMNFLCFRLKPAVYGLDGILVFWFPRFFQNFGP